MNAAGVRWNRGKKWGVATEAPAARKERKEIEVKIENKDSQLVVRLETGDHVSLCQHSDDEWVSYTVEGKDSQHYRIILEFPQSFLIHNKELVDMQMCQRAKRMLEESRRGKKAFAERKAALEAKP